jgi:hypothetical protein
VHENDDRLLTRLVQCFLQPVTAQLAEAPPRFARLIGVETHTKNAFTHVESELDEAIGVRLCSGKRCAEISAIVVIADQEMVRNDKLFELSLQGFVCFRLPLMGKITGNDGIRRVGMIAIHICHAHRKSVERIEPIEQIAGWDEVGIRDVNELLHCSWLVERGVE